jgi:hypothetical protein
MVSELGISHTYRHDTGVLSCYASNAYGQDEMVIQLIVQGMATLNLTPTCRMYLLNVAPDLFIYL